MSLEKDKWLSEQLKKDSFKLKGNFNNIDKIIFPSNSFIEAKLSTEDYIGLNLLQKYNFQIIDTSIQLIKNVDKNKFNNLNIKDTFFADSEDEKEVREIARNSFKQNRFFRDQKISNKYASKLKEEWAGNFFSRERGDWMVISKKDKKILGFLQLLKGRNNSLIIDLIAVDERYRGMGLAKKMITFSIQNCLNCIKDIRVGTQLGNYPAMYLYQKMNFRIISSYYLLHKHT